MESPRDRDRSRRLSEVTLVSCIMKNQYEIPNLSFKSEGEDQLHYCRSVRGLSQYPVGSKHIRDETRCPHRGEI